MKTPDPDMRRGACPALSTPMMTGDGLLARVALREAITPAQLAAVCAMANKHGNGMLDISARGNLQIRGLSAVSAPELDADVRRLALPLREGLAVETGPLAGIDDEEIADPRALAAAISDGANSVSGLAPKMSVIVDGGGRLRLSDLLADIRLVAIRIDHGVAWRLLLGGTEATSRILGTFKEPDVAAAALDLLAKLAGLGPAARGRDLAHAGLPLSEAPVGPTSPFGLIDLGSELSALGLGPAFGQVSADDMIAVCDRATALGITSVRPASGHALLFLGAQAACRKLSAFAEQAGFIISTGDRRGSIAACTGRPACNSATIPTHELAAKAAEDCGDLLDGSFKLHMSGCPKGCAHPQATAITLCGTSAGVALITGGKASDAPFASISASEANRSLRLIADLVRSERRDGENSAACLARLGPGRLDQALIQERR
jgi:precorrin-3B synthase